MKCSVIFILTPILLCSSVYDLGTFCLLFDDISFFVGVCVYFILNECVCSAFFMYS